MDEQERGEAKRISESVEAQLRQARRTAAAMEAAKVAASKTQGESKSESNNTTGSNEKK